MTITNIVAERSHCCKEFGLFHEILLVARPLGAFS